VIVVGTSLYLDGQLLKPSRRASEEAEKTSVSAEERKPDNLQERGEARRQPGGIVLLVSAVGRGQVRPGSLLHQGVPHVYMTNVRKRLVRTELVVPLLAACSRQRAGDNIS